MRRAVILAAGKGTRMKSKTPKVLHKILGQSMVEHVIQTLNEAQIKTPIVVLGHEAELVREALSNQEITAVIQEEQLGTGHAVMQTEQIIGDLDGTTIVALGDTPLLRAETVDAFISFHEKEKAAITVLTTKLSDPTGYGRIIRDQAGHFSKIVEQKDGTPEELSVGEINSGLMCFNNRLLWESIHKLETNNAQKEYYLTDLIGILSQKGEKVKAFCINDSDEVFGVNDRKMLSYAERVMCARINENWMVEGVTFENENTARIGRNVQVSQDVIIGSGVEILGSSTIGADTYVGSNTYIFNAEVGMNTTILNSRITDTKIGNHAQIGPYAHLRQGNIIGDNTRIGNFVEFKGSTFNNDAKAAHLSYIGDSDIGENVNIGCGAITVNYDGFNKHRTIIQNNAFIGCNANLIAPVTIGEGAIIAAGSTITQNVEANDLAIARSKQENKKSYAERLRVHLKNK